MRRRLPAGRPRPFSGVVAAGDLDIQRLVVAAGDAVPVDPGGCDVGGEPVAVDDGVVPPAQQGAVFEVGVAAVDPMSKVMSVGLARVSRTGT